MRLLPTLAASVSAAYVLGAVVLGSCSANSTEGVFGKGQGGAQDDGSAGTGNSGSGQDGFVLPDQTYLESCTPICSNDAKSLIGCQGQVLQQCGNDQLCSGGACKPACEAAKDNRSSVGCDYYPVALAGFTGADTGCFAVFVANTWGTSAHVSIERHGAELDTHVFGRIPTGSGSSLKYGPFDPNDGIPAGSVAIFFLQGPKNTTAVQCPKGVTPATEGAQVKGTGIGVAFHLTTDVPVVAYQMLPFGGGSAAVTGASLLLPTSAWHTNYVAVNAYEASQAAGTSPTLNLIASEDDTEITLLPKVAVEYGQGIPGGPANSPLVITLNKGQHAQILQKEELTGSPIEANKPIGLIAGHECLNVPPTAGYCDHAEQQIPPVRALGYEYACVTHRQRSTMPENPPWRIIGAVAGTELSFDPPSVHSAETLGLGDILEFATSEPFVVKSQDKDHPFLVTTYMTGSTTVVDGYGDADFVRLVPPGQYLNRYVFFTDPTYPETNLVVVRSKDKKGGFKDVELDCAGTLDGWQAVGTTGNYEYTRTDLVRHDFAPQGNCSNGSHEMKSEAPFGLWVWGWGTPETGEGTGFTANVSYGYPAGENVVQINTVYVPPTPK